MLDVVDDAAGDSSVVAGSVLAVAVAIAVAVFVAPEFVMVV